MQKRSVHKLKGYLKQKQKVPLKKNWIRTKKPLIGNKRKLANILKVQHLKSNEKYATRRRAVIVKKPMLRRRQIWQWRWLRKSNSALRNFRYRWNFKVIGKAERVFDSYRRRKALLDFLRWKYSINLFNFKKQVKTFTANIIPENQAIKLFQALNGRWDSLFVNLGIARNLTNARKLLLSGAVRLNGVPFYNYNGLSKVGDTLQFRGGLRFYKLEGAISGIEINRLTSTIVLIARAETSKVQIHSLRALTNLAVQPRALTVLIRK